MLLYASPLVTLLVNPLVTPVVLAAPAFSVERGLFEDPVAVTLTPSAADARMYWSRDGTEPTRSYTDAIAIDATTVLRAREQLADGTLSEVVTQTYVFVDDVIASPVMETRITADARYTDVLGETLRQLPWISMVIPAGLSTAEQAASIEWIDPETGTSLGVGAGVRRVGGHSLYSYEKTSIRLAFREDYGASRLDLDLYGDSATGVPPSTSFDALTLRGGNHDSQFYLGGAGQHIRNLWMDETQLEMGHIAPHGRFAHLAVNGVYTGLYHVRERFNAAMLADYLGGDENDWEAVNGGAAFDGSGAAWAQVVAARGDFQTVKHWINVENFLDYMILNYYAANAWDWSYNHNWIAVGPTVPDRGGFVFQSSDSDITLSYDYTTNILYEPGPDQLFGYLNAEGDADFKVALRDAIYRNLEHDGPLTAGRAGARYARLAALAEDPVVAESARWGLGWWERDAYWVPERDYLLDGWMPYRTDELLAQVRAAGWYPVPAPTVDTEAGMVAAGATVAISGDAGVLYVTTNGEDPRLPGGAVNPNVLVADTDHPESKSVVLSHSTMIRARLRVGDEWGPIDRRFFEVDEAPPLVLNEWNAVEPGEVLSDAGADDAFGVVAGNGGDWIELVVITDHLDLRGWTLSAQDRRMSQGDLVFTDDPLLADLRAGTLLTIAADLPEDAAYAPDAGDWRFHLRASPDGRYVRSEGFDVTAQDWRLTVLDADGLVRFGPAGESVAPLSGISGKEVGLLAADPSAAVRRADPAYRDGVLSTFGAPNRWGDHVQDFSALRGTGGEVRPVEDTADTAGTADSANRGDGAADGISDVPPASGCGCATGGSGVGSGLGGVPALLAVVGACVARARRRFRARSALRLTVAALLGGCGSPDPSGSPDSQDQPGSGAANDSDAPDAPCPNGDRAGDPAAPEVCNGEDDDCDGVVDEDPVDGLPFYGDADGDGWGDEATVVTACAAGEGVTIQPGDCDDTDATSHPGAEEACDGVDRDCDGISGTEGGAAKACPAQSCSAILAASPSAADGARWIALPSGAPTQLWCDMRGGGWTLGFLRNSASTGSEGDFGSGDIDVDVLSNSPADASASGAPLLGWIDLNDFAWESLRVAAYTSGTESAMSQDVPRSALRVRFGEPGYLLYGGDSPYYWCGGPSSYTDGGVGAVNNPEGATAGCKGHGLLGSGWDFSDSPYANAGLTLCGGDGYAAMTTTWGASWIYYGAAGGAQAIWVK